MSSPRRPAPSDASPPGAAAGGEGGTATTGLEALRRVVAEQMVPPNQPDEIDLASLIRFSDDLPAHLDPATRAELESRAAALEPWLQGPFLLGGDLVVGGRWRTDLRWQALEQAVPASLRGRRVLDVGSNAGYDAFMLKRRGADVVMALEPCAFMDQAQFLEGIYRTGVDLRRMGWQQLDPAEHGIFDLIHCNGVLYHEPSPVALLQALRTMLADDGTLILGTMMLADPELSEYLRFVPDSFGGDESWWMVPGLLATRWMLDATGFRVIEEFGTYEMPDGDFPVVSAYFSCAAQAPAHHLPGVRR